MLAIRTTHAHEELPWPSFQVASSVGVTGPPLMVPAGRHAFIFSNRSVAIRHRQFVQNYLPPGTSSKVLFGSTR